MLKLAMAGNIIPAIATTNAVIAGVVILKAFGILRNNIKNNPRVSLRFLNTVKEREYLPTNIFYRFILPQDLVFYQNQMLNPIQIVASVNQEALLFK